MENVKAVSGKVSFVSSTITVFFSTGKSKNSTKVTATTKTF